MPRHKGLPRPVKFTLSKTALLEALVAVDRDKSATARVLKLETNFRKKIRTHVEALPSSEAEFSKFNTNPFVLMIHTFQKQYRHISQIEEDILPAKVFSSMETSAGRMVEAVVLPVYSWQSVPSAMHTVYSVIDGKKKSGSTLCLATLKSGPRCLNDEMSENIADAIIANSTVWATEAKVKKIDFTYGVLYGTKKQSNKKDWHILRNIDEKLPARTIKVKPAHGWICEYAKDGVTVTVTIRIGIELWNYITGRDLGFMEMCVALIRACVSPSDTQPKDHIFTIVDLEEIISLEPVPNDFNVSILQRSQLEWLFFFARHFCDELLEEDLTVVDLE
jgi:hypothetical protein